MKHEIGVRVRVADPLPGVTMMVQRGKGELLAPAEQSDSELVFEFPLDVDLSSGHPNFLGPYAQGPRDARFIYVNSGSYAGAHWTSGRRAKLSLMSITTDQARHVLDGGRLETSFSGVGRDGGPTCASVKGLEWKVVKK